LYSVIIPSLGRLEYLNELIESIFRQSMPPREILLLLDDNEHCREITSFILAHRSLSKYFCSGLNLAEKRNFGASLATTENLIFSDDDDIWAPTKGKLVFEALEQAPVCCHNYGKFGSSVSDYCSKFGKHDFKINSKVLLFGSNRFGGGSSIAAKRYIIRTLPFSSEYRYCEDFEWWSRVLLAGVDVLYLGSTLVKYRTHASNMTNSVHVISHFDNKLALKLLQTALLMLVSASVIALRSLFRPSLSCARIFYKSLSIHFHS